MAEIRESKTLEAYERRNVYANALTKSLEIFISFTEKIVDDVISNGLRPVAETADLDRIIVFRVGGREYSTAGEIYRWDRALGGTAPLDSQLRQLPITGAIQNWISIVKNDRCIGLKRSQFAKDEAAFLSPRGVQSILIVPVFSEGLLWGVITFHDNRNERDFDEDCVDFLRSAARLCAATIIREDKTKTIAGAMETLKHRQVVIDTLNKVSSIFLAQNEDNFEQEMNDGAVLIAETAGIDKLVLFHSRKMSGITQTPQIYRWDKSSSGVIENIDSSDTNPYVQLMTSWETSLSDRSPINGPVALMPESLSNLLKPLGIVSAAVIPAVINGSLWGYALLGDSVNERKFQDDIMEMMRSAVLVFLNAFIRTEMEKNIQVLASEAGKINYDALTGIYNRRFLDTKLNQVIKSLHRTKGSLSLLMIDIDFFKSYNDTYGHNEGDKCLKIIAETLKGTINRIDDFVARYGGEEFVAVLPNTDENGTRLIAEEMLQNIRKRNMPHSKSSAADHVTVSIGATSGIAELLDSEEAFIRCADEAMYQSKQEGRNRYTFRKMYP